MIKKLSFILSLCLFFFFSACSTPTLSSSFSGKVKKEYFTGGGLRSEFLMSDDSEQNGLLKQYGYDGKLTSTVELRNGLKNGIETLYDTRGKVLKKTPYLNNRKNGVVKAYYPNGDIIGEMTFVNGAKHGKAVIYNIDGSVRQEAMFQNGKRKN
ncbi:MAG: hypothetical protein COA92_06905 [Sulfurovum sp.]|nr:MAG: hypothetical protein COA92_06905 [Sulfurovum sp.]